MKTTFFERVIAVVSPASATRRARRRLQRDYTGAGWGRRDPAWMRRGASANAELDKALDTLRDRMRDLVRNNPHAAKAVSTLVTHIVGDGIMPRAVSGKKRLDAAVNTIWEDWTKQCHNRRLLNFAAMQTLACREFIEAGEVLIRKIVRKRNEDGLVVPLSLQIIEADLIDSRKNVVLDNGNIVRQGIEFDRNDKPVNYWLFKYHPGEVMIAASNFASYPVPAGDIIHLYEHQRDQVRGAPWGCASMAPMRDLSEYEDAELMRKKIAACFVGVLVGGDETDFSIGLPGDEESKPGLYDSGGRQVEKFEPGMWTVARGGRDVRFNSPAADVSYELYKRCSLQTIAAGFRVPYELLSGDLAHVSFISGRLGMQEFYRLCSQVQWQNFIPTVCERVFGWFLEAAYLSGQITTTDVKVEWSPPRMPDVDPLNAAKADLVQIRSGVRSFQDVVLEHGRNPTDVLAELAQFNAACDEAGLVLDSDPRKVTLQGILQDSGQSGGQSSYQAGQSSGSDK